MAGRTKQMLLGGGITTAVVQASDAEPRLGASTAVFLCVGLVGLILVVSVLVGLVLASDKAADNLVRIIAVVRGIVPRATSLSLRSGADGGRRRQERRGRRGRRARRRGPPRSSR